MRGGIRSSAWQRKRAGILTAARQADVVCWICRRPIDYDLRGTNPQAPTVDHLVPRWMGGDLLDDHNLAVAHYGCNSRRGAVQRNKSVVPPSRPW